MLVRQLIWYTRNIVHIARHNVIPEEVEELCQANPQTEAANKGRIRVTGEQLSEKGNFVKRSKAGGNAGRRRRAGLNFLFKLSSGVYQQGDSSVMPSDEEMLATARNAVIDNIKTFHA